MGGYKVRLDDGSEIGPMDLAAVRSWYGDGLINADSLVLTPGARRWAPLKQAVDIRSWGGGPSARASARKGQAPVPAEEESGASFGERLTNFFDSVRVPLAGVLLIAGAALAGYWAAWPAQQRAVLHGWPWPQVGLGLLALGLCLFVRPRITRPLVFGALLLAATAALAMIGMLIVQKAPMEAYVVLGGGILACFGFVAILEGAWASWLRTIVGTLLVVGGFGAAFKYGYVAAGEPEAAVSAWTLPESEISDTRVGMRFRVPSGWRLVKPNAPFMAAPAAALARFASVDGRAFAYLVADRMPPSVVQLDGLSERAVTARRAVVSSLRALERAVVQIGKTPGSRVTAESGDFSSPTIESLTLWRDGFTFYTLVGWAPGAVRPDAARRFDQLAAGFESLGGQGTQVSDAVQKAAAQVPFLTAGIVERLMSVSDAGVLEPPEVFKRALILAGRGVPRLEPGEIKELQGLLDLAYRNMDKRERKRLADYLAAVRGSGASDATQDREMCGAMAAAVMQMPAPARERLQALYDQTILAAWTDGTSVR